LTGGSKTPWLWSRERVGWRQQDALSVRETGLGWGKTAKNCRLLAIRGPRTGHGHDSKTPVFVAQNGLVDRGIKIY
jgi:hypothetical protein